MRKVLVVTATTSVGMALLACSGPRPSAVDSATTSPVIYERSARVARAPLSPPVGYTSPPRNTTPLAPYGHSANEGADPQAAARGEWRASPRWADVKGKGCIVVEQEAVENCSKEDLDAGHEVSLGGSKIGNGCSDLIRSAHPADWLVGIGGSARCRRIGLPRDPLADQRRLDETGTDAIDADAIGGAVERCCAGELHDAALARAVG